MLPHTAEALAGVAPAQMRSWRAALGAGDGGLCTRIAELAGGPARLLGDRLSSEAQLRDDRGGGRRPQPSCQLPATPTRDQLLRLLERAW